MSDYRMAIFPGQGAQFSGMGSNHFENFPTHIHLANRILGYSIEDLCQNGGEALNETNFTQPALYVTNVLYYLSEIIEEGDIYNCFAGHSLWKVWLLVFGRGCIINNRKNSEKTIDFY